MKMEHEGALIGRLKEEDLGTRVCAGVDMEREIFNLDSR
mgnify:CR=1 FL=1